MIFKKVPKSSGGFNDLPALHAVIKVAVLPIAKPTVANAMENATILKGFWNRNKHNRVIWQYIINI